MNFGRLAPCIRQDLAVIGRAGELVLVADIKGIDPSEQSLALSIIGLALAIPSVPFGLVADPATLRFYRFADEQIDIRSRFPPAARASFEATAILRHYDRDYRPGSTSEDYLTTLLDAWLSDLATSWLSAEPPLAKELRDFGLLPAIRGGSVAREVDLDASRLPGDEFLDELCDGEGSSDQ